MKIQRWIAPATLSLLLQLTPGIIRSERPEPADRVPTKDVGEVEEQKHRSFSHHSSVIQSEVKDLSLRKNKPREAYPTLNRKQLDEVFSKEQMKDLAAYAQNALGDQGFGTGRVDPVLIKVLGGAPHAQSVTSPEDELAAR